MPVKNDFVLVKKNQNFQKVRVKKKLVVKKLKKRKKIGVKLRLCTKKNGKKVQKCYSRPLFLRQKKTMPKSITFKAEKKKNAEKLP